MSKKSLQKRNYLFDLDDILLSSQQCKFLEYPSIEKLKKDGWNIGSFQSGFRTTLDHSFKNIIWILRNPNNLRHHEVYEIFNAKSMEYLISNLLQKLSKPQSRYFPNYEYDFRTSEFARMNFEKMVDYLLNFPQFKNQKDIIKQLIKPLSNYFEILSRSTLLDEDDELSIDKDEQNKIKEYLKKHDNKKEFQEYQKLKERNRHLIIELYKSKIEKSLDPFRQKIFDRKKIPKNSWLRARTIFPDHEKSIMKEIVSNEERIDELKGESFIREGHIRRLSNVYNHLETFASRIKPLEEFDYLLGRVELQGKYIKDVDSEFKEGAAMTEFDDMMHEKYKTKKFEIKSLQS